MTDRKAYMREYMKKKRVNKGDVNKDVLTDNKPLGDLDAHMRRSWEIILEMWQRDPEKVRRIVVPVCELRDTVAGETRNAGDCTRWGCFGPTYSDVRRILSL